MNAFAYETVWAALPFPAFILSQNGNILDGNTAAEQLSSMSQKQLISKTMDDIFGQGSIVVSTIKQAIHDNGSVTQYNVDVAIKHSPIAVCNIYVSSITSADASRELLVVVQPVGVAQKMSQSLINLSAARSVTSMASMLAHEIRNPLAGISGAAQLLAMNANDEDKELTELISQEARRIGQLVDRVEHFGDQRPMENQPVNIHDVLDRAQRSANAGFASDIEFKLDYDPSLPEASGDPNQLLQVFQNLLKNAAEAVSPGRGTIKMRTSYNSGVKLAMQGNTTQNLPLQIEIIDNGKGIPENLISEIFDPFVTSKSNGTGLGLSLVSKIIAGHGGFVECANINGHTHFTVRLPVWKSAKRNT